MNQRKYFNGSGAIRCQLNPDANNKRLRVVRVKLHMDAAGGAVENFIITECSSAFNDVVHLSQDMNAVTDLVWVPDDGHLDVAAGTTLNFAYPNSNTRDWGLEIEYR